MMVNSVGAVWLYTGTQIFCEEPANDSSFSFVTLANVNFSSINITTTYVNYSYDGSTFYNCTFATNLSSSAANIPVVGSYETNITVDIYNLTYSNPASHVYFLFYEDDGVTGIAGSGLVYDYTEFNSSHRRYYYVWNPSDSITYTGNVSVFCEMNNYNATLNLNGNVTDSSLFTLSGAAAPTVNLSKPPLNGTSDDDLIELNGYCSLGDDATNFSADCYADVYGPAGWSLTVTMDFITNNSEIDQSVTATSYTQHNSTYRRYTYEYNPSNDLTEADMGNFSVNVTATGSNSTHSYTNYTLFSNVFEVYELLPVSNVTSVYNATTDSVNFTWGAYDESVFYFNTSNPSWNNYPSYLNDGNINTAGWNTGSGDIHFWNNNTCNGTDLGDIESVYLRVRSYAGSGLLYITPSFQDGDGTRISFDDPASASWSNWYDITSDTNAPANWSFVNVSNLNCTLQGSSTDHHHVYIGQIKTVYSTGLVNSSADAYVVVRSNTSSVDCPSDGYEVYNGSTPYYNASVDWTTAYFSVFTYNDTTKSYSNATALPYGGIKMSCYNESNPTESIGFNILISNSDVSETYEATDLTNIASLSFEDIPYGVNTIFVVSNNSYRQRTYFFDLYENNIYNISFYLPRILTTPEGGENTTNTISCTITVIDTFYNPAPNCTVNIMKYINETDDYENVSIQITDGNGQFTEWLIGDTSYWFDITKDGYTQVGNKFWTPTIYEYEKTFMIQADEVPEELLMDNIEWDIDPDVYDLYVSNFTLYYNISSSDDKIQWYSAYVYYHNHSVEDWVQLYSSNLSDLEGGSISYTTVNGSGRYAFQCRFKKVNFSTHTFGGYDEDLGNVIVFSVWPEGSNGSGGSGFDVVMTNTLGASPVYVADTVIAYSSLALLLVVTFFLFTFSPRFAGFGIMFIGIIIGAFKTPLNIVGDDVITYTAVVVIIVLGFITVIYTRKKG